MKCSKCAGEMEEGVLASEAGSNKPFFVPIQWGSKITDPEFMGTQLYPKLENNKSVEVYRCTHCGLLESYAK